MKRVLTSREKIMLVVAIVLNGLLVGGLAWQGMSPLFLDKFPIARPTMTAILLAFILLSVRAGVLVIVSRLLGQEKSSFGLAFLSLLWTDLVFLILRWLVLSVLDPFIMMDHQLLYSYLQAFVQAMVILGFYRQQGLIKGGKLWLAYLILVAFDLTLILTYLMTVQGGL